MFQDIFSVKDFRFLFFLCCVFIDISATHIASCSAADKLPKQADILKAWRERASRTKSVRFKWDMKVLLRANTFRVENPNYHVKNNSPLPKKDMIDDRKYSFSFDGSDKMRYEREGLDWIEVLHELIPRRNISVTDSKMSKSYYSKDKSGKDRYSPIGFIRSGKVLSDYDNVDCRLIMLLYRFELPGISSIFDISRCQVVERVQYKGQSCIILLDKNGYHETTCYVDEDRGFIPLHFSRKIQRSGKTYVSYQADLTYKPRGDGYWNLSGWEQSTFYAPGKLTYQEEAINVSFEHNPEIPDSEFRFEFPVGTRVINENSDNREHYILREGGKKRHITREEGDSLTPYKVLLNTEAQLTIQNKDQSSFMPILVIVNISLVVLFLAYFYLRQKKKV